MKLKEIFVVDGNLVITPVKIPESVWKHKSGIFTANVGSQPIIGLRGGWNKLTTYAGFETSQEAKDFKAVVQKHERRRHLTEKRMLEKRRERSDYDLNLLRRWRD